MSIEAAGQHVFDAPSPVVARFTADLERGEFQIVPDSYGLICDCLYFQRNLFVWGHGDFQANCKILHDREDGVILLRFLEDVPVAHALFACRVHTGGNAFRFR